MPLAAGTRLGPYEVLALIGAGGMGEVYKARDTRPPQPASARGGLSAVEGPRIGRPRALFEFDSLRGLNFDCNPGRCYDVARDGQRFYATQRAAPPPASVVTHINLILNWFEELKAKAPGGQAK